MNRRRLYAIALAAGLAGAPLAAAADTGGDSPETGWGFAAGGLAGAALGGPVGLLAGGIVGALTGNAIDAEQDRREAAQRLEAADRRAERLAAELGEARQALAESGAATPLEGLDGALALDVLFDTGSAALDARAEERIARVARVLERYPELQLTLTGHADRRGSAARNETLSRERAEAVRRVLLEQGIAAERLRLRARGEQAASAPVEDVEGLALDRRVALEVGVTRRGPDVAQGR